MHHNVPAALRCTAGACSGAVQAAGTMLCKERSGLHSIVQGFAQVGY